MYMKFTILIVCAVFTVISVRFLLMPGIDMVCSTLKFSTKTRGQIIGYATSVPELSIVLISALNGIFDAGLWNIVSSNVINWLLFMTAVLVFKQQVELINKRFVDELLFGLLSVIIPLALHRFFPKPALGPVFFLLALFFAYKMVDHFLYNRDEIIIEETGPPRHGMTLGIFMIVIGIIAILLAGKFIGTNAKSLIISLGAPSWMIGWILGMVTSIPEFTSFFEIYRVEKKRNQLHLTQDTQQALDAMVTSNMMNLCIILPVGIVVAHALI